MQRFNDLISPRALIVALGGVRRSVAVPVRDERLQPLRVHGLLLLQTRDHYLPLPVFSHQKPVPEVSASCSCFSKSIPSRSGPPVESLARVIAEAAARSGPCQGHDCTHRQDTQPHELPGTHLILHKPHRKILQRKQQR